MTTPEMYWDNTYDSWNHFGVVAQPAAVLLDDDGEIVEQWRGRFDLDDVLAAVG